MLSSLQANGNCPVEIHDVIRGWGQYKDEVAKLPPAEQEKITHIANVIADSFTTVGCVPLGQITVIGHADKDSHGAAFELKVSKERATSVAAALGLEIKAAFKRHGISHLSHGAIAFDPSPAGVGASKPDPGGAKDRTLNRRVEVFVRQRGAPVPLPDTLERRVQRALKLLETRDFKTNTNATRKKRAVCMLNKMLRSDVIDVFVDGTVTGGTVGNQTVPDRTTRAGYTGRYDCSPKAEHLGPPLPDTEFVKLLGTVTALLKSSQWDPAQKDDQILEFLDLVVVEKIYTGILQVERYLTLQVNGFTGKYEGDRARIRCNGMYSDHFDDQDNIYNCWKGYTGGEDSRVL